MSMLGNMGLVFLFIFSILNALGLLCWLLVMLWISGFDCVLCGVGLGLLFMGWITFDLRCVFVM